MWRQRQRRYAFVRAGVPVCVVRPWGNASTRNTKRTYSQTYTDTLTRGTRTLARTKHRLHA